VRSKRTTTHQPVNFAIIGDSTFLSRSSISLAMSKNPSASTLYRLIEAGHLARQALLAPLLARGLEVGDDAVLLGLADAGGATVSMLSGFTGLDAEGLDPILRRLEDKGLLLRLAVGPEMEPGARLSQQGHLARQTIEEHWRHLEATLAEDLGDKRQKHLRKGLKRIIALLRF
jgi:DNA-binding MarR family transcriptional regulator